jgi:hypothetical protein
MKNLSLVLSIVFSMLCSLSNAQINMSNATNTVNVPTAFYDDAGPSANYSVNQNLTQVVTTTTPNFRLKVVFASIFTQNAADSLTVYNGTTPSPANFLAKYFSTGGTPTLYATGNSMSFRFVSDATGNAAGWNSMVYPFGISSLSQTTTPQSTSTTFTITGSNTDWTTGITNVFLVHSVSSASIAVATNTALSATQLKVTFNIPCNADLGLYDLRVIQPTQGLTQMPNAFSVTSYSVGLTGTNILCAFYNTGAITSTVTGGTGAYNYSYSPGTITTPNASNLNAGTYTLSVSDANTCVRTKTITLTQPPSLSNGYPNSTSICSGQSAVLTMTASGGVGGYTYTWNGPNLSSTTTASTLASPLSSTTYTYSVMDANACVATSTLIVNVNTPASISITANPTQVCTGGTSTLSASGASTSYTWSNGATNYSTSVTPAGTTVYSVTGTASNGCTKTETVNVTVNPNPVISATTATPVCLGGNLSFINNSTGAGIYSWSGPSSYASTAANPMIPNITYAQAGTYTLSGMNAATGCSASSTVSVTINALPSLTLTVPAAVCAGSTFTTNGTGATTYTWMPGAVTGASQTFTLSASTTYTVSGTNAAGCIGTALANVGVNALTAISGTATAASTPVAGQVTLYAYEPFLTKFDSVTTQNTSGTGAYTFTSVPAGSYIVKAIPTASTLQITYGSNAISWKNATVITHSCVNSSAQNIAVATLTNIGTGPGSLSGKITEGLGFGQRPSSVYSPLAPGQPIKGVIVKGGKNPGGSMFAQTSTAANGTYTLSGLPSNAAGESYFILVDIPGLDTNTTYHKIITVTNPNYTNLDFVVDSAKVNPVPSGATGIGKPSASLIEANLYPNPTAGKTTVSYSIPSKTPVAIMLYDVAGRLVGTVLEETEQIPGTYHVGIETTGLESGLYFLRIRSGSYETTLRLMIRQ